MLVISPPSKGDRQLAKLAIWASVVCAAAMVPFTNVPLAKVPAVVPAYESALVLNDLITAVLLYGQFGRQRQFSVLAAASAYLFAGLLVLAHILSFPGVFSPAGLLGGGAQTTAWLYTFWHGGFPLLILLYGLLARSPVNAVPPYLSTAKATVTSLATVTLAVASLTLLSAYSDGRLPVIIEGTDYSRMVSLGISPGLLVLTGAAITAMWARRHRAVLDMWLFTVLWVWMLDVLLSSVTASARFELGWYGGRLFGLLAASFVLGSLLVESNRLYAQLADALRATRQQNEELVRSRSALAKAQRLEAVGQLTGGIAHDFNNLLTAIVGSLDLICRKAQDPDRVVRLAGNAHKAADRGARLVRQLMTFARKQNLQPEVLNPNSVLLEFETFASRVAGESVRLDFTLDQAVHPVHVDAAEFQAAILNLVTNARDAMPADGRIRVGSRNVWLGAGQADIPAGDYVQITVTDTGCGMDDEVKAKAFEPFFTTKGVGEGSGLGLSQVFGFAQSAAGHVAILSEPGAGTAVELYLPRSTHQPKAASLSPQMPLRAAEHGERILIVEDDADVMTLTSESLHDLGYTVSMATTADEALGLLRAGQMVDILFSDVVMPGGMNGVQLAVEARRLRPGLRVLLTSGYTANALREQGVPDDMPLLGKPYAREELAERLRLVLRSGQGRG